MHYRIERFAALGRNMAGILFEDEQSPHGRIVKGSIQTQMVRVRASRLRTNDRKGVEHE
jgi:hypothetical protein